MQDDVRGGSRDLPVCPAHGTRVLPAKGGTKSVERPGADVCPLSSFKVLLGGGVGAQMEMAKVASSHATTSGHILGTDKVSHGQPAYREAKQCGSALSLLTWSAPHRWKHQRGPQPLPSHASPRLAGSAWPALEDIGPAC